MKNSIKNFLKLRNKETVQNIGYVTIGKFFTSLLGIITVTLTARTLNVKDYGNLALYLALVEILNIIALPGFNVILVKAIHHKNYSFYKKALKYSFISSLVLASLIVVTSNLIHPLIQSHISSNTLYIINLSVVFICAKSFEKSETVFPALKRFKLLSLFTFLSSLIRFLGLALTIYISKSLYLGIKGYIILQFFLGLISVIIINRILKNLPSEENNTNSYAKEAFHMSFLHFFNVGIGQLDRLLLYSLSSASLGIYQAGISYPEKLREVLKTFFNTIAHSWISYGESEFKKRVLKRKKIFIIGSVIVALLLFFASNLYIPILMGIKYEKSISIASIFGIIIVIKLINNFFQTRDLVFESIDSHKWKVIIYRISYISFLFLALKFYGLYGVSYSILLSEIIYLFLLLRSFLKQKEKNV